MNRRYFSNITALTLIGSFVTNLSCSSEISEPMTILSTPKTLLKIMNIKKIEYLGIEYLIRFPDEASKKKLAKLIFDNYPEYVYNSQHEYKLAEKIKSDFEKGNVVIIKGWILSKTEARQCALLSLNS